MAKREDTTTGIFAIVLVSMIGLVAIVSLVAMLRGSSTAYQDGSSTSGAIDLYLADSSTIVGEPTKRDRDSCKDACSREHNKCNLRSRGEEDKMMVCQQNFAACLASC